MDSFTLKDDDGNSVHYSSDEDEDQTNLDSKSKSHEMPKQKLNTESMSDLELGSNPSLSESVSSQDDRSKGSSDSYNNLKLPGPTGIKES